MPIIAVWPHVIPRRAEIGWPTQWLENATIRLQALLVPACVTPSKLAIGCYRMRQNRHSDALPGPEMDYIAARTHNGAVRRRNSVTVMSLYQNTGFDTCEIAANRPSLFNPLRAPPGEPFDTRVDETAAAVLSGRCPITPR